MNDVCHLFYKSPYPEAESFRVVQDLKSLMILMYKARTAVAECCGLGIFTRIFTSWMTHRSLLHVAYVAPFSSTGVYGVYIYEIGQSLKRATVFLHKDVNKIYFKHPSRSY